MYILTSGVTLIFSGDTRRIVLETDTGITGYTIKICDIYTNWKQWVIDSGSTYLQAFRSTGGDVIDNGQYISHYYILMNDWKIIVHGTVGINTEILYYGNILTSNGSSPFSVNENIGNISNRSLITSNSLTTTYIETVNDTLTGITNSIEDISDNLVIINDNIISVNDDLKEHRLQTEDRIKYILGMVQQNFRIKNQMYDENNMLIYSLIRIYDNPSEAENDINPIKEYEMNADYDSGGRLINYIVKEL